MEAKEIKQQQEVEFYAAGANAWFTTAMEYDKSILALSSGAIGLLVTLMTTVGVRSAAALMLYAVAMVSFFVAIVAILFVLRANKKHIENILSNIDDDGTKLKACDKAASLAFAVGVAFTALVGSSAALDSYISKEKKMAENIDKFGDLKPCNESFEGMQRISPSYEKKSFEGMQNIRPGNNEQPNPPQGSKPEEPTNPKGE